MTGRREYWARTLRGDRVVFCRDLRRGEVVATWSYYDTTSRVWRSPFLAGQSAVAVLEAQRASGELTRVAALVVDHQPVEVAAYA